MNNPWLSIQPVFEIWLVGLIAILLFALLIGKEVISKSKFKVARVGAAVLLAATLTLWLLQPSFLQKKNINRSMLLTENYDRKKADSLISKYPSLTILKTPEAARYDKATEQSLYEFAGSVSSIEFMLGDGLPYYLSEKLRDVIFLPAPLPVGITRIVLPGWISVNQKATIEGEININAPTSLVLSSPGLPEDSIALTGTGVKSFSLSFQPHEAGAFLYSLTVRDSTGNEMREPLPVQVTPAAILSVLFLQKFPMAETRYLKNFLSEQGHALAVRTQVSKSKFHVEFANRAEARLGMLNTQLLQEFDVVILDGESLLELSAQERTVLEDAVRKGLGVIVRVHSSEAKKKLPLLNISFKEHAHDTVRMKLLSTAVTLPVVPVSPQSAGWPIHIVHASGARTLSGYLPVGAGKAGFQLLPETYGLLLEGRSHEYAALWAPLLDAVARSKQEKFSIQLATSFPYYANEPLSLRVISTEEEPVLTTTSGALALQEDVWIDNYWQATWWAKEPGWHTVHTQDSAALNFFVPSDEAWRTVRIAQQQQMALHAKEKAESRIDQFVSERVPISPWLFFTLFLLMSGFLWLAPKL